MHMLPLQGHLKKLKYFTIQNPVEADQILGKPKEGDTQEEVEEGGGCPGEGGPGIGTQDRNRVPQQLPQMIEHRVYT